MIDETHVLALEKGWKLSDEVVVVRRVFKKCTRGVLVMLLASQLFVDLYHPVQLIGGVCGDCAGLGIESCKGVVVLIGGRLGKESGWLDQGRESESKVGIVGGR
jgi:hypothetical protein